MAKQVTIRLLPPPGTRTVWEHGCLSCTYSTIPSVLPGTPYACCPVCGGKWGLIDVAVYRDGRRDSGLESVMYTKAPAKGSPAKRVSKQEDLSWPHH